VILTKEQVLELVPQQPPFRFIDRLVELTDDGAVGEYTFKPTESFYAGHFPGDPVTPGVILLETMCQTGVVAYGIYLYAKEAPADEVKRTVTLFTDAEVEFSHVVRPGDTVRTRAEKVFWRRKKLKCKVTLELADGTPVASGVVSGLGVTRNV
jgi:3-hydroxyacyl-[acyl-carrier-protein] dehydratase